MKMVLVSCLVLSIAFTQYKQPTEQLLKNPFDLQTFKKAKGPSNSGGADVQTYYFKPQADGAYFRFFLFTRSMGYKYERTENKTHPVKPGTGLQIITYKPKGKYFNDYFDPTETLIEVSASYNDPDLPELAFIGLDTTAIKQKLGVNFIRKNNCFIYSKDNNVLLLRVQEGVITCFKYTRLNKPFREAILPEKFTKLECTNVSIR